jgi:uncharacterized protein
LSEFARDCYGGAADDTPLSGIVRDPGDDMVLACAIDGRADTIVSRDKDLLSLGAFRGSAIIPPEVFRQQLRDAQ